MDSGESAAVVPPPSFVGSPGAMDVHGEGHDGASGRRCFGRRRCRRRWKGHAGLGGARRGGRCRIGPRFSVAFSWRALARASSEKRRERPREEPCDHDVSVRDPSFGGTTIRRGTGRGGVRSQAMVQSADRRPRLRVFRQIIARAATTRTNRGLARGKRAEAEGEAPTA